MYSNRAAQGIAELERALAIDRNLADAHAWIGLAKCFLGRSQETEAHIQDALRLSPRYFRLPLGGVHGNRKGLPRQGRGSSFAIAPGNRDQPEFPARTLLSCGRFGRLRPTRRSSQRGEGRAFLRSHLHHPPLPRGCPERQPRVSRRETARVRNDAKGWGPGRIGSTVAELLNGSAPRGARLARPFISPLSSTRPNGGRHRRRSGDSVTRSRGRTQERQGRGSRSKPRSPAPVTFQRLAPTQRSQEGGEVYFVPPTE